MHKEEIGNRKGLPKTGMDRDNGRHKTEAVIVNPNVQPKTGMDRALSVLPKTGKVRGSNAHPKAGMGRGLSDRTSLEAIDRGNPTASKTLRKTGATNLTGPHREQVVPKKINK